MFATIFFTTLLPLQVHPISYSKWVQPNSPMVQAVIDTARIVGLPRLKTMDRFIHVAAQTNELQIHEIPSFGQRKAFLVKYLKNN